MMARHIAAVLALPFLAASVTAHAQSTDSSPYLFAATVTTAVQARTDLAGGAKVVVVVAMDGDPDAALIGAMKESLRAIPASVKAVRLAGGEKRYLHALEIALGKTSGLVAIVALDPGPHPAQAIAQYARDRQILTISSKKEDVDPIAMAVEASRNQAIFYSEAALRDARVGLTDGFLSATNVRKVTEKEIVTPYMRTNSTLWRSYDRVRKGLPPQPDAPRPVTDLNSQIRTLQRLIRGNPREFDVKGDAAGFREYYLPHYDLGRALWAAGDCDCAVKEWARSEQLGYINALEQYQSLKQFKATQCPPPAPLPPSPAE